MQRSTWDGHTVPLAWVEYLPLLRPTGLEDPGKGQKECLKNRIHEVYFHV